MDSDKDHAVSIPEAKERLRTASQEVSPAMWIKRHPIESVTMSTILGYLAGSDPDYRSSLRESILFFLKLF
jgi:hypothetical protein